LLFFSLSLVLASSPPFSSPSRLCFSVPSSIHCLARFRRASLPFLFFLRCDKLASNSSDSFKSPNCEDPLLVLLARVVLKSPRQPFFLSYSGVSYCLSPTLSTQTSPLFSPRFLVLALLAATRSECQLPSIAVFPTAPLSSSSPRSRSRTSSALCSPSTPPPYSSFSTYNSYSTVIKDYQPSTLREISYAFRVPPRSLSLP